MLAHKSPRPTKISTCCSGRCPHQGLCLSASELTVSHRTCRQSGGRHVPNQQNGRSHRLDSPDRHHRGARKGRRPSPRRRGQSRDRSRGRSPASSDRKRHKRSPEHSRHRLNKNLNKSRERGSDRSRPDSSKRGGQRHDRQDGASRPGASSPGGGFRGDKEERQNGLEARHSKGSTLHSAMQGSTNPRNGQGQQNGFGGVSQTAKHSSAQPCREQRRQDVSEGGHSKGSALQSAKEGSMKALEGAERGSNLQNNRFQLSQGDPSLGGNIDRKGSQRYGGGQPGAPLDAHPGAAAAPSGKQTTQAWPEVAEGIARDGRPGQPGAPSFAHHGAAQDRGVKGMQRAWREEAEGSALDGPGQPRAPSEPLNGAAEALSGKQMNQAWPEVAEAWAAPVVGQPAASLGFKQMSGISDEQHGGVLAWKFCEGALVDVKASPMHAKALPMPERSDELGALKAREGGCLIPERRVDVVAPALTAAELALPQVPLLASRLLMAVHAASGSEWRPQHPTNHASCEPSIMSDSPPVVRNCSVAKMALLS